ncbi:MAG: redox-sensing transcriptional repressor Rex [Firmicutes bacterium]|nr:redox-sensing transcriptional repressor Rex [Bacillota bacterium]
MGKLVVIPRPTIERLPLYLHSLTQLDQSGVEVVSSEELGRILGITSVQIRKDLAYFGEFGRRGVGYDVSDLMQQITEILGVNRPNKIAIVGAGHLGQALARYEGFNEYGFMLAAIFDNDPEKIGTEVAGQQVLSADYITEVVKSLGIKIGIVTVPATAAQKVADQLLAAGVRAIWNFAPTRIEAPIEVEVRQENLSVGLLALSYHLAQEKRS